MNYASEGSVLLHKPHLELIKGDLYSIAKRLKGIDPGYFIVFNRKNGKYEVHSAANRGWNTYCFTVPHDRLDARTIDCCKRTNIRIRGELVHREAEQHNAKVEAEHKRNFERNLDDGSFETADRAAWGIGQDELHEGYRKTHHMGGGNAHDGG